MRVRHVVRYDLRQPPQTCPSTPQMGHLLCAAGFSYYLGGTVRPTYMIEELLG
jgi:hypothetical protein